MDKNKFTELSKSINNEGFAEGKLALVKTAVSDYTFTCDQAVEILKGFNFDDDKLDALKSMTNSIEDPENKDDIVAVFKWDEGKEEAEDVMENMPKAAPKVSPLRKLPPLTVNQTGIWSEKELAALVKNIESRNSSEAKLKCLKKKLSENALGFSSSQVIRLLKTFHFADDMVEAIGAMDEKILGMTSGEVISILGLFHHDDDRLKVLEVLKNTLTDPENKFFILNPFIHEKEEARNILESAKPRSFIFGTVKAKSVLFVIGVSGSMNTEFKNNRGEKQTRLTFVKAELEKSLKELDSNVLFNLVVFSSSVKLWKKDPVTVSDSNIAEALNYISTSSASGLADIAKALEVASGIKDVDAIYFLTDGTPTVELKGKPQESIENALKKIAEKNIPINSVALLSGTSKADKKSITKTLMEKISRVTKGIYRAIE
jgi:hypothetical protein